MHARLQRTNKETAQPIQVSNPFLHCSNMTLSARQIKPLVLSCSERQCQTYLLKAPCSLMRVNSTCSDTFHLSDSTPFFVPSSQQYQPPCKGSHMPPPSEVDLLHDHMASQRERVFNLCVLCSPSVIAFLHIAVRPGLDTHTHHPSWPLAHARMIG